MAREASGKLQMMRFSSIAMIQAKTKKLLEEIWALTLPRPWRRQSPKVTISRRQERPRVSCQQPRDMEARCQAFQWAA